MAPCPPSPLSSDGPNWLTGGNGGTARVETIASHWGDKITGRGQTSVHCRTPRRAAKSKRVMGFEVVENPDLFDCTYLFMLHCIILFKIHVIHFCKFVTQLWQNWSKKASIPMKSSNLIPQWKHFEISEASTGPKSFFTDLNWNLFVMKRFHSLKLHNFSNYINNRG